MPVVATLRDSAHGGTMLRNTLRVLGLLLAATVVGLVLAFTEHMDSARPEMANFKGFAARLIYDELGLSTGTDCDAAKGSHARCMIVGPSGIGGSLPDSTEWRG